MSDMGADMVRRMRDDDVRLRLTETKETLGGIAGFTSFYATGTYSPTYLGGTTPGATTYTIQQGTWVRLGSLVVATGTVVWSAATGTGDAQISLPFAAANVANQNFSGSVRPINVTFANSTPQVQIASNTAYFTLQSPLTNAASTPVAIEAAGNVIFTIAFFIS